MQCYNDIARTGLPPKSTNTDISEELAALRVIGANRHETLTRMAGKLAGTAELSASLTVDLSNSLLGHIERCEPPIRTSRVKSKSPGHAGGAGYYDEHPVIADAAVSAKFVRYGVNAEGLPDMRRSVWDRPPADYQPRVDAKNRN
jgi:hypothetical protein